MDKEELYYIVAKTYLGVAAVVASCIPALKEAYEIASTLRRLPFNDFELIEVRNSETHEKTSAKNLF